MGILSDHKLWGLIASGNLKIEPAPAADAISPSTIDLTLGDKFTTLESTSGPVAETSIDTSDSSADLQTLGDFGKEVQIADGECFELKPSMFVLGWTRETVSLQNYLAARIDGRSSLGSVSLSIRELPRSIQFSTPRFGSNSPTSDRLR